MQNTATQEVLMNKLLAKGIISIAKEIECTDYIYSIKYMIFFASKILYDVKIYGRDILAGDYSNYRSTPDFYGDKTNVFNEHINFDLNDRNVEEKIFDLKYNLPFKDQIWTINYRTFFSINGIVNRPDLQTCEAKEISLMIEKM